MPRAFAFALVVMLASACGPKIRRYPDLSERPRYACCNLHFNKRYYASDANYSYAPDPFTVPVGTRVQVTDDNPGEVYLIPEGQTQACELAFKFGTSRITADQYFYTVFVESDPREALASLPADTVTAIQEGRLVPGMTKAQVLMARGYPPFHRTDGLEADVWTYYENPDQVDVVQFVDGRLSAVTRTDAPTR